MGTKKGDDTGLRRTEGEHFLVSYITNLQGVVTFFFITSKRSIFDKENQIQFNRAIIV